MKTVIHEERLLVISDLHLGNPYCTIRQELIDFYKFAQSEGYSLCINGDGLDIAQSTVKKLANEAPSLFYQCLRLADEGLNIYYVIGNHDIILEHFLEAWGNVKVLPFLNVWSGDQLIRIEHGHLYDPMFTNHSEIYEAATRCFGLLLNIYPKLYRLQIWAERFLSRLQPGLKDGIIGEHVAFQHAARELTRRGFDAVLLGHTHHAGRVVFKDGKKYINSGSWLVRPDYVEINQGEIQLKTWDRSQLA